MKPALPLFDWSAMRKRVVSRMTPNDISADPNGTAVCDTRSRTSYTVKRINVLVFKPSHPRYEIVHKNCGLEQRCEDKQRVE